MDLDLLKDYLAVVEHGSILAAAEATGTSQPTLSRRIRDLEDSLGVLLLNRTARGISVTTYGESFKQHAEKLLRDHQLALDDLRALKSGSYGHARIGIAPALSGYLPGTIARLMEQKPSATFEVLEGTYDSLVEKTLRGEIDGAFTMLPTGESLETLACTKIGPEPLVIIADANHPLEDSESLDFKALGNEAWILMNRPRSIIDGFHQLAKANGLEKLHVSIETSSLDFLKSVIRGTTIISILPRGGTPRARSRGSFIWRVLSPQA